MVTNNHRSEVNRRGHAARESHVHDAAADIRVACDSRGQLRND